MEWDPIGIEIFQVLHNQCDLKHYTWYSQTDWTHVTLDPLSVFPWMLWLFLSPAKWKDLLNTALKFCHQKNYSHIFLWTISAQESARILYKNAGFKITETNENNDWGTPVLEERWDLNL